MVRKHNMTQYDFISEGDSPAFFHLIDVGLDNLEHPEYGGWGGRMVQSGINKRRWEDGDHVTDFNPYSQKDDKAYPQTRWIDVLQNDFAARADWCVSSFDKANHAPVVELKSRPSMSAKPGETISLKGNASDPDGNEVTYKWWQYFEVDSYAGKVIISNSDHASASFKIPKDAKPGDTIHVILEVKDNGTPALTRYKRTVISVR